MDLKSQPVPATDLPVKERFRQEVRVLAVIGGPIVVSQLMQMATIVLDTVMSGRASALDLAGVSVGASLWVPLFLLSLGIVISLTPIIAQAHGARHYEKLAPAVYQAFYIAAITGALAFFTLRNMQPVMALIGVNEDIQSVAIGYLKAFSWGMPAILSYNVLRAYADGLSLTKPAMLASIIGLSVNAPLNYIFIYGKFGLPAMGGVGCGWASAIALWVSFLFMVVYVVRAKEFQSIKLFQHFHAPDWKQIKEQLSLGLPMGFMYLVESSMFSVIALFLSIYGADVVASHQIALNIASLVFMVPLSIGFALTIRVGFLIGARQPLAARFGAYTGLSLTLCYGITGGIMLWTFAEPIVALYTKESEVLLLAAELLAYAAVFQLADSIQVASVGVLRGYKDIKIPMFVMILAFWVLSIPLGYSLGMTHWFGEPWQAKGFWVGIVVGLVVAAVLLSIRVYTISSQYIDRFEPKVSGIA